jgi:hypothetical protein
LSLKRSLQLSLFSLLVFNGLAWADQNLQGRLQTRALLYFLEQTEPHSGLVRDRARNFGATPDTGAYRMASVAATGFGMAVLANAANNGSLDRTSAYRLIEKSLSTAYYRLENFHGWFYHFVDWHTGKRTEGSEVSTVDTAWFLAGALYAAQLFPWTNVADLAQKILHRVQFNTMRTNGGSLPAKMKISMGWTPEGGYLPYDWDRYDELMLLYVLGLGHPSDPLPLPSWSAWGREPILHTDHGDIVGADLPLFAHQYSHLFIDFRGIYDGGREYFRNSIDATAWARQRCLNDTSRETYRRGFWGLSAGDSPDGYAAWSPFFENGTVCLGCVGASAMFLPEVMTDMARWESIDVGAPLLGRYGFSDSINLDRKWVDSDVIGITVGALYLALANMNENTSVWQTFKKIPSVQRGLVRAHFENLASGLACLDL